MKLNPQRGGTRGRQFVSSKAVDAHLRYLERDGVTRDGEKGQVYSAEHDVADGSAFLDRGREDRHQFRFIVSAEDGVELSDLRQTTRDLMAQMEADLGTRLDWIAVDHHNTGHPHTHILVRGITDDGKRLDIAGDYIAHGIRERASEIVTLELGRQTEQEVSRQLELEVDAERFTRLDRMLIAEQDAGSEFADLRPDKDMALTMRQNRALMIDRARKLERMGLATEHTPGVWTISPRAEQTLREMGTRGDIIKTMHQALDREGLAEQRAFAGYTIHPASPTERIVGRVVAKALGSDELGERMGLTIDGMDGRVHYLEVPAAKVEDISRGSIVAVNPPPSIARTADENILQQTDASGIYRPSAHQASVRETMPRIDHERHVQSHVRRLEALRRAGIVERIDADRWNVPADLPDRGLAYDRQRFGKGPRIDELSHLPLDRQVRHEGATWLDRTMLDGERKTMPHTGFGGDVRAAWEARKQALADMGYVQNLGGGKRALESHEDLTLTKLYNVLEALREGRALTDAERDMHDRGLVTLIRQHHDAIDALVAEAYGWPADLPDEEILTRLVALNKERAAERRAFYSVAVQLFGEDPLCLDDIACCLVEPFGSQTPACRDRVLGHQEPTISLGSIDGDTVHRRTNGSSICVCANVND